MNELRKETRAHDTATVEIHQPTALHALSVAGYTCEIVKPLLSALYVLRAQHAPQVELADSLSQEALEELANRTGLNIAPAPDFETYVAADGSEWEIRVSEDPDPYICWEAMRSGDDSATYGFSRDELVVWIEEEGGVS